MPAIEDGRHIGVRLGEQEMAERRATDPNFTYAEDEGRQRAAILLAPEKPGLKPITAATAFQFILDRLITPPSR